MVILRNKKFSEKSKRTDDKVIGTGVGITALGLSEVNRDKAKLTGLEGFYHNTSKPDAVLKDGIKAKYAEDPGNITNTVLDDIDMSEKKGKVYLGKNKIVTASVGKSRKDLTGNKGKTLKLNIPYEDLKKMKQVDNPELRGAKSAKEYRKIMKGITFDKVKKAGLSEDIAEKVSTNPAMKFIHTLNYGMVGPKGTSVIEGDVGSKYIKGSKDYQKYGLREFGKYVKKNPARFAKSVAKNTAILGLGAATIGAGVKMKKKKKHENT